MLDFGCQFARFWSYFSILKSRLKASENTTEFGNMLDVGCKMSRLFVYNSIFSTLGPGFKAVGMIIVRNMSAYQKLILNEPWVMIVYGMDSMVWSLGQKLNSRI